MLRQNYVGFRLVAVTEDRGYADTIKEDEEEEEGLLDERLEDEVRRHRANVITSMRFRTWELSVICTTDTTHTVVVFCWGGGGDMTHHDNTRTNTNKTQHKHQKMTYK